MHSLMEYLKSPELVVRVQEFFGIEYLRKDQGKIDSTTNNGNLPSSAAKKRTINEDVARSSESDSNDSSDRKSDDISNNGKPYRVTKKFWYYLFIIGTELGDEIFYATFIPFWFWNIDSAVGRRVVMVWSAVMYVGQSLKDVIRWPRPGYPASRLQKKWSLEYGMPSTHAMVSVAIPFSVLIYTYDRYVYSLPAGLAFALIWCAVICVSRVYLGMHSVLDIIAGLALVVSLMIPLIPIVDTLDYVIVTGRWSPIFVLFFSIMLIVFYPDSGVWTPTRGDTALTVSVCAGIEVGAWLHYMLGDFSSPPSPPPYEIIWPSYAMLGMLLLRTVLGLCCIVATRAFGKSISYAFVCFLLGRNKNELRQSEDTLENKNKIIVELSYKFFTCAMIGFNTQFLLPNVFKLLRIGRPDFYTEI
ncbi:sphingosine-1-phosphate phosphatase 2-like [Toxorhynchites rutilus septentrionalis]|uniref:sphingosine-1-phosphate phosphatase 2-like n=1 Tax=Toxorhynchites rutilus septentrionalis TaxID=329112 RepID=UPI00247A50E5|nr:sphingosine-1-phosphate phosphatase 2-like [Toxorhynchites rutilus septentrionalis]